MRIETVQAVEEAIVIEGCTRPSGRVRIETVGLVGDHPEIARCTRPSGRVRIETIVHGHMHPFGLRLHPSFGTGED